jgi:putative flavoprotein involved in K+ transport
MTRATSETRLGRRLRAKAERGGDALIGIPERELTDAGVIRVPRIETQRGGLPVCGDQVLEPRVIVWCTGFAPDYRWIDLPVFDDKGYPRHVRGASVDVPGLHFLGLRFQHRMTSSLIGGVGHDAASVAERIASCCDAELDRHSAAVLSG